MHSTRLAKFISKCCTDFWSILRCLMCFWSGRRCRESHSECQHSEEHWRGQLPMLPAGSQGSEHRTALISVCLSSWKTILASIVFVPLAWFPPQEISQTTHSGPVNSHTWYVCLHGYNKIMASNIFDQTRSCRVWRKVQDFSASCWWRCGENHCRDGCLHKGEAGLQGCLGRGGVVVLVKWMMRIKISWLLVVLSFSPDKIIFD